jgi:hypothetical protein
MREVRSKAGTKVHGLGGRLTAIAAVAFMLVTMAFTSGALTSATASAAGSKKALILGSSVTGGTSSKEYTSLVSLGFTPTVVTEAHWNAMTASQFGAYQVLVIGDPTCNTVTGNTNRAVWTSVVMGHAGGRTQPGNRVVIGTDPVYHGPSHPGAYKLITDGLRWAGALSGRTGVYYDVSCENDGHVENVLNRLSAGVGTWTDNPSPPCGSGVAFISTASAFAGLTTADLAGWSCSVHQSFPTFKSDWAPLALATDTPTHPVKGTDTTTHAAVSGEPYVLIAGVGVSTTSPDISITPLHGSGVAGTTHTVTAHVTNGGKPSAGQLVTFTVTGQNGGVAGTCGPSTCKTDASGNVTFTYPDTFGVGADTIIAGFVRSGTAEQASADMTWVAGTPAATPCTTTTSTSTTTTVAPTTSSTSTSTSTTTSTLPPPAERIIKAAVTTTSSSTSTSVAPTTTAAPATTAAPTTVDPACTATTVPAAAAATAVAAEPTFTG